MVEQDQKITFKKKLKGNQRGQAALEYVLLLVVIVSLVFGVKKAFGHLNEFMQNYIGKYIVCLMEYGELPSLGVSDSKQKVHLSGTGRPCDKDFAGFTFEGGRPPTDSGTGGSGSTGTSRSTGSKTNSGESSRISSSNASKSGNSKGSDSGGDSDTNRLNGGGRKDSGSGSSPYTSGQVVRSSNRFGTSDGGDYGSKVRVVEEDEEAKGSKKKSRGSFVLNRGSNYGTEKYRAITGTMEAEIEKRAPKKLRTPTASIKPISEGGSQFGPYKKTFVPPEAKKVAEKEDDNSGFSFGYFMRWLMIAAMVLAIIVFFGGQIMNYSNSSE